VVKKVSNQRIYLAQWGGRREEKGREGKGREGKGREGKGREGLISLRALLNPRAWRYHSLTEFSVDFLERSNINNMAAASLHTRGSILMNSVRKSQPKP